MRWPFVLLLVLIPGCAWTAYPDGVDVWVEHGEWAGTSTGVNVHITIDTGEWEDEEE